MYFPSCVRNITVSYMYIEIDILWISGNQNWITTVIRYQNSVKLLNSTTNRINWISGADLRDDLAYHQYILQVGEEKRLKFHTSSYMDTFHFFQRRFIYYTDYLIFNKFNKQIQLSF